MKKLFYNIAAVVNPSTDGDMTNVDIQSDVAIAVDHGKITEIGNEDELMDKYNYIDLVNLRHQIVVPGFVDPHTHPVFWKTREDEFEMRLQGKSYEEIASAGGGINNSVRALRKASQEELLAVSLKRVKTFMKYGITTIEAKSGYGLSFEDEIKSLRVIQTMNNILPIDLVPTFLGAHEVPDEYKNNREKYIDIVIHEMIPYVAEEKLAEFCDVFCEEGVYSVAESERILQAAADNGLKTRVHADELNPLGGAEMAARAGAVTADHLLQISDQGIADMKKAGVIPILLPGTAFFLQKTQYAPARKMIEAGLPVALATDYNPGSSYTQNIQFIMALACLNMEMMPSEVFHAVTINSARSLLRDADIGTLEAGKYADFAVLDIPDYRHIVYNYAVNHVSQVYKHGKCVYNADQGL